MLSLHNLGSLVHQFTFQGSDIPFETCITSTLVHCPIHHSTQTATHICRGVVQSSAVNFTLLCRTVPNELVLAETTAVYVEQLSWTCGVDPQGVVNCGTVQDTLLYIGVPDVLLPADALVN